MTDQPEVPPPPVMEEEIHLEILPPPAVNSPEAAKPKPRGRPRRKAAQPVSEGAADDIPEDNAPGEDEPIPDAVFQRGLSADDDPPKSLVEAVPKAESDGKPKSGPPSVEEWQRFLGRVVLRTLTQGYIALVLGDLEEELSAHEREMIALSKEDLMEMAAPLASFATKNKFTRKHGREIIAATESYEAVIVLMLWMRRVNRIAKRHKRAHEESQPVEGYVVPEGMNGHGRPNGPVFEQGAGPNYPEWHVANPGTG